MGTIRTTVAALLASLALVAFESDALAQARRSESGSTGTSRTTSRTASRSSNATKTTPQNSKSSGAQINRRSSSSEKKSSADRPATTTRRQTQTRPEAARPSSQNRPSTVTRPSTTTRPSSAATRPSSNDKASVRRPSANRPAANNRPATTTRPSASKPSGRVDNPSRPDRDRPMQQIRPDRKPDPHRKHPRDRDFVLYSRPTHFWAHHDHCFGFRVKILPAHVRRHHHHGITYYCYNDIWYRPYGGYYVVCRPPFGTVLAANLIADMAWTAVRLQYYYTAANTYSQINENNKYIAEQNAIIAQNNATIAAQNQTIAMNQELASQAYGLADELGLVQSYAAAGSDYFYQDGIFYVKDSDGEYKVIVPPAGALVETLPEDYDMVTLKDNNEYYKVDDTVYRITISDGKPLFEVLGQLYA